MKYSEGLNIIEVPWLSTTFTVEADLNEDLTVSDFIFIAEKDTDEANEEVQRMNALLEYYVDVYEDFLLAIDDIIDNDIEIHAGCISHSS